MSDRAPIGDAVWARVQRLTDGLRQRGVEVGISELGDAASALVHIDLGDRDQLRTALSCTLVKRSGDAAVFAELFDRLFPRALLRGSSRPRAVADPGAVGTADLRQRVASGLEQVEGELLDELRLLAEESVDALGGFDDASRGERYHVYRVLRALDLATLLTAAILRARQEGAEVSRAELEQRAELLRQLITEVVRARLTSAAPDEGLGAEANPFDIHIARASAHELSEMRAAVRPLARRLAVRLRRRRSGSKPDRADLRATARRSLASGGVPFEVRYRRPQVHRPQLFVLCDVSGSVADVAGFTLTLISALAEELARTRSFAFVDAVDEITELVESCPGVIEPWQLLAHGKVIGADGHSDYGAVLRSFWSRYGQHGITDRSTVIITGDARSNYRDAGVETLAEIAHRARALYWLNPEPSGEWDTRDSVMASYRPHCTAVLEACTLAQLATAVEELL